jgi:GTP-binding protein HflX
VLGEIGVDLETPRFEAWNKLDLLDEERRDALLEEAAKREDVMPISAWTGEGVDALIAAVAARLTEGHRRYTVELPTSDGAGAAWLHQHGEVIEQSIEGERALYEVRMAPRDYERFLMRD